jgi:hypothetical protein
LVKLQRAIAAAFDDDLTGQEEGGARFSEVAGNFKSFLDDVVFLASSDEDCRFAFFGLIIFIEIRQGIGKSAAIESADGVYAIGVDADGSFAVTNFVFVFELDRKSVV